MSARLHRADLDVARPIVRFVEEEALPGTGTDAAAFWTGLSALVHDMAPRNRELIALRADLQERIDAYHRERPGPVEPANYEAFLRHIGYLVPEPDDVEITTTGVDTELTTQAGPQLVVPLLNARFAINAANARWGSLYDALYGSDVISDDGDLARSEGYNPRRGAAVIERGRCLLDEVAPLTRGSHSEAVAYRVVDDAVSVRLADDTDATLQDRAAFAGYTGEPTEPSGILLVHHGLHLDVRIDRDGSIGRDDPAGVQDIIVESAVTTIMDLEDSVAAVDAEDKADGYRNWRDLMNGTLTAAVTKAGRTFTRRLNSDRNYTAPDGHSFTLPGRSLSFVRHVGLHLSTDAVLDSGGDEVPEGILDTVMTALGSLHELRGERRGWNSRTGSMYVVKPKLHGPDEVTLTVEVLSRVERILGLPPATLKIGIMDEERRTSVNLKACIAAAAERVVFINTGFLDRTGDEIHTSRYAGPMARKADMKTQPFMLAYENSNVDIGLGAGIAQIGKGMWAMPDQMRAMLEQKIEHVRSGATTAWVPSPTAATLHALHYHDVDAYAVQQDIAQRPRQSIAPMLVPPLAKAELHRDAVTDELDTNVQSILGYVVRWIDQGIGCSKVPDLDDIDLMEDRATLRISSQLLANWLLHGVITTNDVQASLERIATVVDQQNAHDPQYEPLIGPDGPGLAFNAARELILEGTHQPSGYTEPILHRYRRKKKRHP